MSFTEHGDAVSQVLVNQASQVWEKRAHLQ